MRQSVRLNCIASAGAMLDVLFMKGLVECIDFFGTDAGLWHGFLLDHPAHFGEMWLLAVLVGIFGVTGLPFKPSSTLIQVIVINGKGEKGTHTQPQPQVPHIIGKSVLMTHSNNSLRELFTISNRFYILLQVRF